MTNEEIDERAIALTRGWCLSKKRNHAIVLTMRSLVSQAIEEAVRDALSLSEEELRAAVAYAEQRGHSHDAYLEAQQIEAFLEALRERAATKLRVPKDSLASVEAASIK